MLIVGGVMFASEGIEHYVNITNFAHCLMKVMILIYPFVQLC
jgi:hypothetical protein